MTPQPPTRKQLTYLRALALRTGQTFTYPHTRGQASAQIRRLKAVTDTGMTIAELEAEDDARALNDDLPLANVVPELAGHSSGTARA